MCNRGYNYKRQRRQLGAKKFIQNRYGGGNVKPMKAARQSLPRKLPKSGFAMHNPSSVFRVAQDVIKFKGGKH